jgi:hypothetical protein
LITSVKEDTQAIKIETTNIKQDTSQIASLVQEIGLLRLQVSQLENRGGSGSLLLQRFLAESTTYAESVTDKEDSDGIKFNGDLTSTILQEGDESDAESTRTLLDEPLRALGIQPGLSTAHKRPLPVQPKLPVSPVPMPVRNRDAHFQSSPGALPAGFPIVPRGGVSELVTVKDTLKAPSYDRGRSMSDERLREKVIERICSKAGEVSSGRGEKGRIRSVGKELVEAETISPQRKSSKHRDEESTTGAESSFVSNSLLSANRKSGNQSSFRSGTSKSSINNPELLETVENAIRQLIQPELKKLKKDQKLASNRYKAAGAMIGGALTAAALKHHDPRSEVDQREQGKKRSKRRASDAEFEEIFRKHEVPPSDPH